MVFTLDIAGLRVAKKSVVNVLDPPAYSSPIKIGQDGHARVCSQVRRQLAILQQCDDPLAERFAIMIGHNECIVQVAQAFGRAFKADDGLARQHVV